MNADPDALGLEARRLLFDCIRQAPGAHLRKVHRASGLAFGQVLYHLAYLEKNGLVVVRKDGRFSRYYVANGFRQEEKDVLAVLRHETPRRIAVALLVEPGLSHGDLLPLSGVNASTLSFHLKRMIDAGLVAGTPSGRSTLYRIVDERACAKALVLHRESFDSDVVDRFADLWLGLNHLDRAERERHLASDEELKRRMGDAPLHRVLGIGDARAPTDGDQDLRTG